MSTNEEFASGFVDVIVIERIRFVENRPVVLDVDVVLTENLMDAVAKMSGYGRDVSADHRVLVDLRFPLAVRMEFSALPNIGIEVLAVGRRRIGQQFAQFVFDFGAPGYFHASQPVQSSPSSSRPLGQLL